MKILEYNGFKNFICDNINIAMSWASYYTNNDSCFINGNLYRIEYRFNEYITLENGTCLYGDYCEFKNLETQEITLVNYNFLKEIRNNNKIKNHFIVFDKGQLQINDKNDIDNLMKYKL